MAPPVVVYPPDSEGGRRVRLDDTILGRAFDLYDTMDLLERAGLNPAAVAFEDTDVFEWRGGGPYVWGPGRGDGDRDGDGA